MRGGYLHNEILLPPIEQLLRSHGAIVHREHPVTKGRRTGFVDLFAAWPNHSAVIEVELTSTRIAGDLTKSRQVGADLLVIVTPTQARSVRRRLGMKGPKHRHESPEVWVYPLGQAIEQLTNWCALVSPHECQQDTKTQDPKRRRP